MQRWYLYSPIVILALLLVACNAYGDSQPVGALAAQPSAIAQDIDPTASPEAFIKPTATAAIDSTIVSNNPPDTCPITAPPNPPLTPPSPYLVSPGAGYFLYGTDALWTAVPGNGVWSALPHNPEGYTQKVFWWRQGYSWTEEPEPQLTVTGRRLDAPAPPLNVSRATNAFAEDIGSAMLVGVDFPTLGCWEISGRYADAELSFVVWVAP